MIAGPSPVSPKKQVELAPVHDFAAKLCQPSLLPRVKAYVRWQAEWRRERALGRTLDDLLATSSLVDVPVSINLDVTTACNYRCDHCVDMEILNTGIRYDHDRLKSSLSELAAGGLKSVIVIGGGEPTVYPGFEDVLLHLKALGLKVGIVTNGSGMDRITKVAHCLDSSDWVRLSLDSGSDETFQAMHKPRKAISLDEICEGVARLRAAHATVKIGFSFIIVWKDCEANDAKIVENVHEIVLATERARRFGFDYISLKPFLTRAPENNAEIVGLTKEPATSVESAMAEIRRQVDLAKKLETESFRVVESTNLRVLENGTYRNYTEQPRHCHAQFFRQVLSPLGIFNCPVYRHVPNALMGDKHAYSDPASVAATQKNVLRLIERFDAASECKEVICLYNHLNWFIEDLIEHPAKLEALEAGAERGDFFL